MDIKGKRAIVTGGAMGIGYETAKRLLNEGCVVTILDLSEPALINAKNSLSAFSDRLFLFPCDMSLEKDVISAIALAEDAMGGIDILVNNAGVVFPGYFHEVENHAHVKTVEVNINGLIYAMNAVLKEMYQRNSGVIVNISSAAGTIGVPKQAIYAASKWAVWGMTESLRHEARNLGKNVHFASIHPSYLAKGMFEGATMRGLGNLIVPRVRDHTVVADAIVDDAIKRKKNVVFRPRSVRTAVLLRGILPERLFFFALRLLSVHKSMDHWKGRH